MPRSSQYPELHQYLSDLYEAGMSIENLVEHGYYLAERLAAHVAWKEHRANNDVQRHQEAALMLRVVCSELNIGREMQKEAK